MSFIWKFVNFVPDEASGDNLEKVSIRFLHMISNQRSTWYNSWPGGRSPSDSSRESPRQVQRTGHQDRCNLLTFTVYIPDLAGDPHQIHGDEPIYLLSANPWVLEGTKFAWKIIWGGLETESGKESYFLQKWDLNFWGFGYASSETLCLGATINGNNYNPYF